MDHVDQGQGQFHGNKQRVYGDSAYPKQSCATQPVGGCSASRPPAANMTTAQ